MSSLNPKSIHVLGRRLNQSSLLHYQLIEDAVGRMVPCGDTLQLSGFFPDVWGEGPVFARSNENRFKVYTTPCLQAWLLENGAQVKTVKGVAGHGLFECWYKGEFQVYLKQGARLSDLSVQESFFFNWALGVMFPDLEAVPTYVKPMYGTEVVAAYMLLVAEYCQTKAGTIGYSYFERCSKVSREVQSYLRQLWQLVRKPTWEEYFLVRDDYDMTIHLLEVIYSDVYHDTRFCQLVIDYWKTKVGEDDSLLDLVTDDVDQFVCYLASVEGEVEPTNAYQKDGPALQAFAEASGFDEPNFTTVNQSMHGSEVQLGETAYAAEVVSNFLNRESCQPDMDSVGWSVTDQIEHVKDIPFRKVAVLVPPTKARSLMRPTDPEPELAHRTSLNRHRYNGGRDVRFVVQTWHRGRLKRGYFVGVWNGLKETSCKMHGSVYSFGPSFKVPDGYGFVAGATLEVEYYDPTRSGLVVPAKISLTGSRFRCPIPREYHYLLVGFRPPVGNPRKTFFYDNLTVG